MRTAVLLRSSLGVAIFFMIGCDFESDSAEHTQATLRPPDAGHERMVAELAKIADDPKHLFLGDQINHDLRVRLSKLNRDTKPSGLAQMHKQLGRHELRLGNNEQAIEHLKIAYEMTSLREDAPPQNLRDARFFLAVAYLRVGETQNCVERNRGESCIFPFQGAGIYRDTKSSESAIRHLNEILDANPRDAAARWLLNLAYMTTGGYPSEVPDDYRMSPMVFESEEDFPRFVNVAEKLGVDTFSLAGGAIAEDFDNDGWIDIMTSSWDDSEPPRYFHNDGNGGFDDESARTGLAGILGGLNLVHADYDGDGFNDVFVLRGAWLGDQGRHPNSLLRNNRDGTFTDVTYAAGLAASNHPTQTAAWADFDNDGDLDLYVGNESAPSQLFVNDGSGSFTNRARSAGVENLRFAKGVSWGDYDADGYPDLYVSNLTNENRLYHNERDGTFTDVAKELGVQGPKHSFACWFWDYDNDGILDLFVASYMPDLPTIASGMLHLGSIDETMALYKGIEGGGFDNVSREQNVDYLTSTLGANFGDLDNDGFLDFYLGTGFPDYAGLVPNRMFRNRGGSGFSDITTAGGFGHIQKGHAVTFADFDNDGDQDIYQQLGGMFPGDAFMNVLFENPGFEKHWIKLQLVGDGSNRSAIGARIRVEFRENGEQRSIYRHVSSGGSFGSQTFRQEIGLGLATSIDVLEIFWPTTGRVQKFRDVSVDRFLKIHEGQDQYEEVQLNKASR